jgi:nucleolin
MSSSEEKGTLFVGKLSWDTDDDMLYEAFKSCDGVVGARVITNKETGRSRGFGYVDFSSPAAAESALETMQGIEIDGRAVNLDKSAGRGNNTNATPRERVQDRARRNGDVTSPESDTLFVGNLPFDITQDEVKDFFAEAGDVQGVRLPTDM